MHELAAWILFPLIALAICTGIGLLAARLARVELPPAVVPALGFAAAIAVLGPLFATGVDGVVGCIVLVALAIAGLAAGRGLLKGLVPRWGALSGVAAYALHIAPVALTGSATFLGYNLLNDTAIHLSIVDWIGKHGSTFTRQPPSSFGAAINDYVGSRYPLGSHELLAALKPVVGLDPAIVYQPFLALCAGLAAAAVYGLLRSGACAHGMRAGSPGATATAPRISPGVAALIAFAALASQLVFSFALQGSIKELAFIVCLAAAAGVAGSPALVALPAAALYSIYGIYAMPWIVPLGLAVLVLTRPAMRSALVGVAVFAVAIAVYVPDSIHYYDHGHTVLQSGQELGPLAGPLKPLQAGGVWLNGDYRFTPSHSWITYALDLVVILLAAAGAVRERRGTLLLFLAPALLAYGITAPQSSPYIQAKLLAILSPALVVAAGVALTRLRVRPIAVAAAAVLGLAFLVSDALAYRIALPAPTGRLAELSRIDRLLAGKGPVLVNEYEEYVKHYMRGSRGSDPYESWTAARAQLRNPTLKVAAHTYDLDQMKTSYIERWRFIVLRRSPVESRPPSNYDRVWAGEWYEVWRRTRPAPLVHVALGTPPFDPTEPLDCRLVRNLVGSGTVVASIRPRPQVLPISGARPLPPGWYVYGQDRRMLEIHKGGQLPVQSVDGAAGVNPGGPVQYWIRGRTARADAFKIDADAFAVPRTMQRIGEWIPIGMGTGGTTAPNVTITRPQRSLRPGDAQPDIVGPVVAVANRAPVIARGAQLRQACGAPADWIDVIRP